MIFPDCIHKLKSVSATHEWVQAGSAKEQLLPVFEQNVGVQGMFVRVKIPDTVDCFNSMVQLEFMHRGQNHHLARLDWKAKHTNRNIGPAHLRLLTIESTHHHSFELNYQPEMDKMRGKNLPLASPVTPDPETLPEFLATCEDALMIQGLAKIERPAFQGRLL